MKRKYSFSAFTVIVTFFCLSLVGLALIPELPVKLNPSRTLPGMTVSFSMPGNSAKVVEQEVTSKLEGLLSRISGVEEITSTSDNGRGSITLRMDKHADMEAARFEASTLIRQAWSQFPSEVSYPVITSRQQEDDDEDSHAFMVYTLNAPSSPILIQRYGDEHIKPVIAQIPGIYKVEVTGATEMEWKLVYDEFQLEQVGLSVSDISQAIQQHFQRDFLRICQVTPGGNWLRVVCTGADENEGFQPQEVQVKTESGRIIALDKVLKMTHEEAQPTQYFRINGLNSIYLSIYAEEGANQLELAAQVKEKMAELSTRLPSGYETHISSDETESIRKELDKIYLRTGLTVLILLIFVALITWNLRYMLLIVVSLAVNLAVAVIFYYFFHLEMQLYSLAGITISLNLVIDNTIVMADHVRRRHDLKAFLSILAATLTTVGALVIIFFMDEKIRLNLQDFAAVVIINLMISLAVALLLVPALVEKMGLDEPQKKGHSRWGQLIKRAVIRFTHGYERFVGFLCRHRVIATLIIVLIFGLPVTLLPKDLINKSWYKDDVRPILEKSLGGTLRLFMDKVYEGSYFNRGNMEPELYVNATLPNGSTLEQMNTLIRKMETFLSEYKEIRQFQTSVYSARRASISIQFREEAKRTGFPYSLKSAIISKALTLGGGYWSVYGLEDQGFSNSVTESAGSFRIKLKGYNYEELSHWAEQMKTLLLQRRRIKEVLITSEFSYWKDDYTEFYLEPDKQRLLQEGLSASDLFASMQPLFMHDFYIGSIAYDNQQEYLRLTSSQHTEYDIWSLLNRPISVKGRNFKLSELAQVTKTQAPQKIAKENQEYVLCLQYDYIGSAEQGKKLQKADIETLQAQLPMGYTIEGQDYDYYWGKKDKQQYWLLALIVVIIFFTTSILFNSLKQPLAIIFEIPVSYIGVFLTFYWWRLNFDQGGFASFVLLCGITVNASIYILNEYNNQRRLHPGRPVLKAYTKAWNIKIIPIFLTVVSTILGFIPFMVGSVKEGFWFPLAAGTIGGLIASMIGLFIWLPVWSLPRKQH